MARAVEKKRPSGSGCANHAGSEQDLADHLPQGFNAALYEALTLITIQLSPLRERRDDIPELVKHFIRRHNNELHKTVKGTDDRALQLLGKQDWPGNVAELENVIKRACILARGDALTLDDIRDALERSATPAPAEVRSRLETVAREALQQELIAADGSSIFYKIVGEIESALVSEALRITGGNQVKAAELLGVNRTTLRRKMHVEGPET